MIFILRILKNTIVRILLLVTVIVALVLGFAFRNKVLETYHHAWAYYYVYLGDRQYKKGQLQDAIDYYNNALSLYPEHVKARYNLGNIYVAYEDYNAAVDCYEKTLGYFPDYLNARINLGIVLSEKLLDFDRAIEEYKTAVNTNIRIINIPYVYNNKPYVTSGKSIAYYNLGLAYKAKSLLFGDRSSNSGLYLAKAADSYKKSLEYVSDSYDTRYNLAMTYHLLGNIKSAKSEYCSAINLEPLSYEAHYNLALLLRDQKDYKNSLIELEKAGLIIDSKGDEMTTHYIYDVYNDVTQKMIIKNDYTHLVEKVGDEPTNSEKVTYVNGKVVVTDEFDKAMLENFKKCAIYDEVKSEENSEE